MKTVVRSTMVVFILSLLTLISGCSTTPKVITKPYGAGRILLLPPRDVVQFGVPHSRGVGSGQNFQKSLKASFTGTSFEIVTTDNPEFSQTEIASKEKGLAEAKRRNAKYCLQIVLGEFQDAAPMTFRPDYVYLDRAVMFDVQSGESVWELSTPNRLEKGNIGGYEGLLEEHAKAVASSINDHLK